MPRYVLRPSRPLAVFVAVGALAMLAVGLPAQLRDGFQWFTVLWALVVLGIAATVLVMAFAGRRGDSRRETRQAAAAPPGPHRTFAVIAAVAGVGMIIFGLLKIEMTPEFTVLWVLGGLGIIGFNLWAAFSRRGALHIVERRD